MDPIRADSWPLGINNVAKPNRLPQGAVRNAVNVDPGIDGAFTLRPGYSRVVETQQGRACYALGKFVVAVDADQVMAFDTETDEVAVLGQISANAPVAAAELNGQLYLNTPVDSVRTDGTQLKPWAVPAPGFQVEVIEGTLTGRFRVAVVAVGADGEESGADPVLVDLPVGSGVRVSSSDTRTLRVYMTVADGATLFYQSLLYGGAVAITSVVDDSQYLESSGLHPMPYCERLVAYNAVLVGSSGTDVYVTLPMQPHLFDPIAGFFTFPAPVLLLAATEGGVYIVADKTYFLSGVDTAEPQRRTVLDVDAVAGSAVPLPDGRVAWFTRYGQAIGQADGTVELVTRQTFAPDIARSGAAAWVGHNGNEMVVTTMRGATDTNNLATGDFADLEVG